MAIDLSTVFTGVRFENPFLLSSAPPTESESNILRAFDAGWGGVVTKTIGLHPVVNVGVPVPREPFSFGGWNDSKFGVGDITGRGSIEFWTQAKKMTTKWNKEAGTNWMS